MSRRDYKEFAPGEWYHVYNRGNSKMEVFRDVQDYAVFRSRLCSVLGKTDLPRAPLGSAARTIERIRIIPFENGAFSIAAYCLMPNHFHFLLRQNTEVSISRFFLKLLTSYSMYFNRKHDHVGHVFQDRIRAVRVEDDMQLKHLSAYIHANPKVAGLVRDLKKWPHSSYLEYLTHVGGGICDTSIILEQFKDLRSYEWFVQDSIEDIRARKDAVHDLMIDE